MIGTDFIYPKLDSTNPDGLVLSESQNGASVPDWSCGGLFNANQHGLVLCRTSNKAILPDWHHGRFTGTPPKTEHRQTRKNDACIAWEQADFIKMVLIRCLLVEHGSICELCTIIIYKESSIMEKETSVRLVRNATLKIRYAGRPLL